MAVNPLFFFLSLGSYLYETWGSRWYKSKGMEFLRHAFCMPHTCYLYTSMYLFQKLFTVYTLVRTFHSSKCVFFFSDKLISIITFSSSFHLSSKSETKNKIKSLKKIAIYEEKSFSVCNKISLNRFIC